MFYGNFSIEEFKERQNFSFIQSHFDTNVLNHLCAEPGYRIEIVKSVVLSVKKRDPEFFLTDFHVKWAMECIGYAFSLQLDQSSIISQAILIYNTWLMNPQKRPECISLNEAFYQREILGHMSLLFLERPWDSTHAELCSQVIKTFRQLIRKNLIFSDNFTYFLKLLLMCFGPILSKTSELAKKIGGEMSKALLELFVRSEVKEPVLWLEICSEFSKWVINTEVINSWVSVAVGLTQKIVNLLYGEGNEEVNVTFRDEGLVTLKMSIEHAILSWNYLVVNILENTGKSLFDPVTHKDIVKSVTQIVDVLILVSDIRVKYKNLAIPKVEEKWPNSVKSLVSFCSDVHKNYNDGINCLPMPSVKGVLDIFGDWLFTQANIQGCHVYGQAEAIGSLCRIFCKAKGPVPEKYLGKFYKALFKGFKFASENNTQVANSILKYSVKLLTQDHSGIRILLHKSCIFKVINSYIVSKDIQACTKRYCYNILASIVPVVKHYKKQGIMTIINDCLIHSVTTELDGENIIILFWSICAYIAIIDDCVVLERLVKSMVNKVLVMDFNVKKLFGECLNVLCVVPFMMIDCALLPETTAKDIISKFILSLIKKTTKNSPDSLSVTSLNLLLHWIIKFPAVFLDITLKTQIFECLMNLKNFDRIKDYVNYVELYCLNNAGKNYPQHFFAYNESTLLTNSLLTNNFGQPLKHFLFKHKVLVSVYNIESSALIILRNQVDRFVWKFIPTYGSISNSPRSVLSMNILKNKRRKNRSNKSYEFSHELSSKEAKKFEKVRGLYMKSKEALSAFQPCNEVNCVQDAARSANDESHYRVLLSEMGFFQYDLIGELSILYEKEIQQSINELDSINDKEVFIIPIFYLDSPESTESEIMSKSEEYPVEYIKMLSQMGIFLTKATANFEIFKSAFNILESFGGVLLTREYYYEIFSLAPCLFGSSSLATAEELLKYSQIIVMWNQRNAQPFSQKYPLIIETPKFKRKTVILITPLRNEICKVNVIGPETNCGPLQNNMLVPLHLLGKFITKTIANFYSNASSRLALSQRKVEIFNSLKDISKRSEATKNGKTSAVLSHAFNKPSN